MNKPKVLHYYSSSTQIGGPLTYINTILNSELNRFFQFDACYQMMGSGGINIPLLLRMRQQIKKFEPDILHVHGLQSEGLYGLISGRLAGCKKILVTVHGLASDTVEMNPVKKILYKYLVEPYTVRNVDFVYCVCNYASNRPIIKKNARNLLNTIYTGIGPVLPSRKRAQVRNDLDFPDGKIVGIVVSRIVRDKGFEELSEAVHGLSKRGEDRLRFCIVGEGGYLIELEQRLKREISSGYVRICGRRSDVPDLLSASDFFILPSWHENFPITLLEAGQAGLPTIATPVGGIPEIIEHGRTGLLVSKNDPLMLIKAIDQFLDHPEQITLMGRHAKEKMRTSLSLGMMTEKIHQAYTEILS